jgi:hypothetical protein
LNITDNLESTIGVEENSRGVVFTQNNLLDRVSCILVELDVDSGITGG